MVFGNVSRFSDRNEIIFFPVSKQEETTDWKIENTKLLVYIFCN